MSYMWAVPNTGATHARSLPLKSSSDGPSLLQKFSCVASVLLHSYIALVCQLDLLTVNYLITYRRWIQLGSLLVEQALFSISNSVSLLQHENNVLEANSFWIILLITEADSSEGQTAFGRTSYSWECPIKKKFRMKISDSSITTGFSAFHLFCAY